MDAEVQIRMPLDIPAEDELLSQPVFPLIHAIKLDIEQQLDSSLSWDQLNALDVNYSVFRPLLFKYAKLRNYSIILSAASSDLAFAPLKRSRADACEILAMKLLRRFTAVSDNPIDLFSVLTVGWDPLQGCPESCLADIKDVVGEDLSDRERISALELAIRLGQSGSSLHLLCKLALAISTQGGSYSAHQPHAALSWQTIISNAMYKCLTFTTRGGWITTGCAYLVIELSWNLPTLQSYSSCLSYSST
ncbi:hypothetical protein FRC08_003186, partial [Ceratobasidium sp. 394]